MMTVHSEALTQLISGLALYQAQPQFAARQVGDSLGSLVWPVAALPLLSHTQTFFSF